MNLDESKNVARYSTLIRSECLILNLKKVLKTFVHRTQETILDPKKNAGEMAYIWKLKSFWMPPRKTIIGLY